MRTVVLLLLLAAAALAGDARAELAAAEKALAAEPDSALVQRRWAKAAVAVARELQRAEGYPAAIAFLETRLTHTFTVEAYAEACLWGGEEERGIAGLRAARDADVGERLKQELELLWYLRRYDEAARRAREVGWAEGVRWAEAEGALREKLLDHGRRAWRVAAIAFLVLAAAGAAMYFLAPERAA